jgi:hypothetical protein
VRNEAVTYLLEMKNSRGTTIGGITVVVVA